MKKETQLSTYFLFLVLGVSLYFAYLIFRPYASIFLLAAIFTSILYPLYNWFQKITKGRDSIAALLSVIVFVLLIVIPLGNFMVLLAKESAATYAAMQQRLSNGELANAVSALLYHINIFEKTYLPFVDSASIDIQKLVLDLGGQFNSLILTAASALIRGTTQLVTSLFFLLLTMYFLFKDGEKLANRVGYLTPLSSKYDRKLFDKFREVGRATILSSLLIAIVQGSLAGFAYYIIGYPAFFLGVATAVTSFVPIVGTMLITIPVLVSLAITGHWYAFIFAAIWGFGVVAVADNVVRTWVIKGQSQIHPLLVFFSLLGGLEVFGLQGIVFGPLILAITLTMLSIYEVEYEHILER